MTTAGLSINMARCKLWARGMCRWHLPPALQEHAADILCDGLVACGQAMGDGGDLPDNAAPLDVPDFVAAWLRSAVQSWSRNCV